MRNEYDYRNLIDGYSFSLSLLKLYNGKLYNKMMKAQELLDKNGTRFSEMIRDLRVDFANENDEKLSCDPKVISIDYKIYEEIFAFNYSPLNKYIFAMLYEKRTPIGSKKVVLEIMSRTFEEIKEKELENVFRISTLDSDGKVKKIYAYIAAVVEDSLLLLKQDLDKQQSVKPCLEIPLEELDDFREDLTDLF